jgi:hypothetical protein
MLLIPGIGYALYRNSAALFKLRFSRGSQVLALVLYFFQ